MSYSNIVVFWALLPGVSLLFILAGLVPYVVWRRNKAQQEEWAAIKEEVEEAFYSSAYPATKPQAANLRIANPED